jgi:hypothetical protein
VATSPGLPCSKSPFAAPYRVSNPRADSILAAAVVLDAVVDLGGFDGIEVTRAGLREGVFFRTRLLGGEPLLPDWGTPPFATSRSSTAHA